MDLTREKDTYRSHVCDVGRQCHHSHDMDARLKAQGTSFPREDRYRSVPTAAIHGSMTVTGLTLVTLFTL